MNTFTLHLLAADRGETIEGVLSFVAEDASGSFGLLPNHERFMTVLGFSLARYRGMDGVWDYLGIPGGVLYFADNHCRISTRRYLRDRDVTRLATSLGHELMAQEQALIQLRRQLARLEGEMFKRWAELARE
jgi:F-type H+-transporting ATPase subunit epsilon